MISCDFLVPNTSKTEERQQRFLKHPRSWAFPLWAMAFNVLGSRQTYGGNFHSVVWCYSRIDVGACPVRNLHKSATIWFRFSKELTLEYQCMFRFGAVHLGLVPTGVTQPCGKPWKTMHNLSCCPQKTMENSRLKHARHVR